MRDRFITEPEGYKLLLKYGIPLPEYRFVSNEEMAVEAGREIGRELVLKIVSKDIIHKSDAGGVLFSSHSEPDVRAAYRNLIEKIRINRPDAAIEGVLVVEKVRSGLEILVGGKTDPTFGKVLTIGAGGTMVEFLNDIELHTIPVTGEEIIRMIENLKINSIIKGYRGSAPLDVNALVRFIASSADLFINEVEISEFDFNPVFLYENGGVVVDVRLINGESQERNVHTVNAPLSASLFAPRTIAVIGASSDPRKVGYAVFRNLLSFGGLVYPINSKRDEVLGKKAWHSLGDIPGPVDLALITTPANSVPKIISECAEKGVPLIAVISSGFRESGKDGEELEKEVINLVKLHKLHLIGPNCLGVMVPPLGINATFDPMSPKPGSIAFVSQSGAIITTMVDLSVAEGIGFSSVISVGNQADLGFEDYLAMLESDPATKSIVLYIEEVRNGPAFLEIMQRVTKTKPVIAIKAGSSEMGRSAASSHTGSLAGDARVYEAVFRQCNVFSAHSLRDAFLMADLLAEEGYPKGNRAVVISSAGGFTVLASDYAEHYGISLIEFPNQLLKELDLLLPNQWSHKNPMDIIGDAGPDRFAVVFDLMLANEDLWDIAFVIAVPSAVSEPSHLAHEIVRFRRNTKNIVIGCMLGGDSMRAGLRVLHEKNIPNFSETQDAFRTVGMILGMRKKEKVLDLYNVVTPAEETSHRFTY